MEANVAALAVASAGRLATGALQAGQSSMEGSFSFVGALFFILVIVIIAATVARGLSGRRGIQRPATEATSFPPPPPPDTVMVKCEYCGCEQMWKETCAQCGAPMPKPKAA